MVVFLLMSRVQCVSKLDAYTRINSRHVFSHKNVSPNTQLYINIKYMLYNVQRYSDPRRVYFQNFITIDIFKLQCNVFSTNYIFGGRSEAIFSLFLSPALLLLYTVMIYDCENFCHGGVSRLDIRPADCKLQAEWTRNKIFWPLNAERPFFTPRQNLFEYLRVRHTVKSRQVAN